MSRNELKPFGTNIWSVEQPSNFIGVPLGLRMTVIRLANRQLALHSVIPCSEETERAIQSLGEVRYLIVPNREHTRFINEWQQRYPDAQLYLPTATPLKQQSSPQCTRLPLKHDNLHCLPINGLPRLQEFAFFHPESQTLILTDLAFNLGGEMSLWGKTFLQLNGAYNRFTPSRILKSWIKDNEAFRSSIQQLTQWDFEQIIIAHGEPIVDNAKHAFRQAFQWAL